MKARHPVVHYPSPMGFIACTAPYPQPPAHQKSQQAQSRSTSNRIHSAPAIEKLHDMEIFQEKNLTLNRK